MPTEFDLNGAEFENASEAPVETPVEAPEPSFGNQFLQTIPEQDRTIVAKYVKDWDGNVTKRFQSLQEQLKPYQSLGDVESLQRGMAFYQGWQQDPETVFFEILKALGDYHGDNFSQYMYEKTGVPLANMNGNQEYENYDEEGGYDPGEEPDDQEAFLQQLAEQQQELYDRQEAFEEQQQSAADDYALDTVMQQMHNQFGQFDDYFVLTRLANGDSPEQAIQNWTNLGQYFGNRNSQEPPNRMPPIVSAGQGGIPHGQVDPSKLKAPDRKALVQQYLDALDQ